MTKTVADWDIVSRRPHNRGWNLLWALITEVPTGMITFTVRERSTGKTAQVSGHDESDVARLIAEGFVDFR
jgi:hypothetical protein